MRDDWYAKMSASHALKVDHTSPTRDKVMLRVNSRASVRTRSSSRTTASSSRTPRRSKTSSSRQRSSAGQSTQSSGGYRRESFNNEDVLLLTPTIKKADVTETF